MNGRGYLAFDFGASGGRAILGFFADGRLELREVHRFPNGPVRCDGALFWDFERYQRELVEGLRKALAGTRDIAGIGIDTWGVDYVLRALTVAPGQHKVVLSFFPKSLDVTETVAYASFGVLVVLVLLALFLSFRKTKSAQ